MAKYDAVVGQAAYRQVMAVTSASETFGTSSHTLTGIEPGDTPMYGLKIVAGAHAVGNVTVIEGSAVTVTGSSTPYGVVISTPTAFPTDSYVIWYQKTTPRY